MFERFYNVWRNPSDRTPELLNSKTPAVDGNNSVNATQTTSTTFQISNAKLKVPVVSLTINDNINFLENMKQGVKWTIYRNRYRSEITTQPKYNKLDGMIDPTLRNINRLFVLSFKNCDSDPTKILLISITCH